MNNWQRKVYEQMRKFADDHIDEHHKGEPVMISITPAAAYIIADVFERQYAHTIIRAKKEGTKDEAT